MPSTVTKKEFINEVKKLHKVTEEIKLQAPELSKKLIEEASLNDE